MTNNLWFESKVQTCTVHSIFSERSVWFSLLLSMTNSKVYHPISYKKKLKFNSLVQQHISIYATSKYDECWLIINGFKYFRHQKFCVNFAINIENHFRRNRIFHQIIYILCNFVNDPLKFVLECENRFVVLNIFDYSSGQITKFDYLFLFQWNEYTQLANYRLDPIYIEKLNSHLLLYIVSWRKNDIVVGAIFNNVSSISSSY